MCDELVECPPAGMPSENYSRTECIDSQVRDETCPKDVDIVIHAVRFILNLKEKFRLSQVSLDFVINSVDELLRMSAANFKSQILTTLHQDGVEKAASISNQIFSSLDPFLCLKTEHQQTKFYKENFNLVVSCHPVFHYFV